MARKSKKKEGFRAWLVRVRKVALIWLSRLALACLAVAVLVVGVYRFVDPPLTYLTLTEKRRLGSISHSWVPMEEISPELARAVVAAEDANFCLHWGFDMAAIRDAASSGAERGASTLTQQVVKNVFLWPDRSWTRKTLEALITPIVELLWPKRRILEVYLNVAEFGEGVIGAEAAAEAFYRQRAEDVTLEQSAAMAAVLPNPKARSVTKPSDFLKKRALQIADGAKTIQSDGRSACFED